MNHGNHEAADGRTWRGSSATLEAKLANAATSSELDLQNALNDVLADVGLTGGGARG